MGPGAVGPAPRAPGRALYRAVLLVVGTLRAMSRLGGRRPSVREAAGVRLVAVAALAALLAVGAHLAAGGSMPLAVEAVLGAVALTGASMWIACELGRRRRGLSASAVVVGVGQGGLELMLWSSGHGVRDPLLAAGLHAGASLLLTAMALGVERLCTTLSAVVNWSWPLLCWSRGPEPDVLRASLGLTGLGLDVAGMCWWPEQRQVRGPPLPA